MIAGAAGLLSGSGAALAALVLTEETLSLGGLSAYLGMTQPEAATNCGCRAGAATRPTTALRTWC